MTNYIITTDSTCDLPVKYLKHERLKIIPIEYEMGGKQYFQFSDNELPVDEFYTRLTAGELPTTSQISPFRFEECWREYLSAGIDVLYICFSSALSGTYNNALAASASLKGEFPDRQIFVVDSRSASGGEGLLVSYALNECDNMPIDKLFDYLEKLKFEICHYFTVNSLFHLHRGGRVSRAAAIIGTALQLKPLLNMNDTGELIPIDKCMGRRASLSWLAKMAVEKIDPERNKYIFVCDGNATDEGDYVASKFNQTFPDIEVVRGSIGAVVGTHCGEGVMAIFFISKSGR